MPVNIEEANKQAEVYVRTRPLTLHIFCLTMHEVHNRNASIG